MNTRVFTLKSGRVLTLTENEMIILERMRDEDGTEYRMVLGGGILLEDQKSAPRDQIEPLLWKDLVAHDFPRSVKLRDDGREVLAQMRRETSTGNQYAELSMDELVELATERATSLEGSRDADDLHFAEVDYLVDLVKAIKARSDVMAGARARIGEYLRQKQLRHARQEKNKGYTRSKDEKVVPDPMSNILDEVREDMYAKKAKLLASDVALFAPALVRDTKAEFMEVQQRRLAYVLEHNKLSEKQIEVLHEVAKGNVSNSSYSGLHWAGKRLDGRTFESLRKRGLIDSVSGIGFSRDGHYCIKRPADEGYQG